MVDAAFYNLPPNLMLEEGSKIQLLYQVTTYYHVINAERSLREEQLIISGKHT